MIKKYRKKPIDVEMVEWTGENWEEINAFAGAVNVREIGAQVQIFDELHQSWGDLNVGGSVVKGVKGEFYPIEADVVADTYDEVTD